MAIGNHPPTAMATTNTNTTKQQPHNLIAPTNNTTATERRVFLPPPMHYPTTFPQPVLPHPGPGANDPPQTLETALMQIGMLQNSLNELRATVLVLQGNQRELLSIVDAFVVGGRGAPPSACRTDDESSSSSGSASANDPLGCLALAAEMQSDQHKQQQQQQHPTTTTMNTTNTNTNTNTTTPPALSNPRLLLAPKHPPLLQLTPIPHLPPLPPLHCPEPTRPPTPPPQPIARPWSTVAPGNKSVRVRDILADLYQSGQLKKHHKHLFHTTYPSVQAKNAAKYRAAMRLVASAAPGPLRALATQPHLSPREVFGLTSKAELAALRKMEALEGKPAPRAKPFIIGLGNRCLKWERRHNVLLVAPPPPSSSKKKKKAPVAPSHNNDDDAVAEEAKVEEEEDNHNEDVHDDDDEEAEVEEEDDDEEEEDEEDEEEDEIEQMQREMEQEAMETEEEPTAGDDPVHPPATPPHPPAREGILPEKPSPVTPEREENPWAPPPSVPDGGASSSSSLLGKAWSLLRW